MKHPEITVAPPNSVLLVVTAATPDIPEAMEGQLVTATSTSVAIGTLSAVDGPTTARLTDDEPATDDEALELVFNGTLRNLGGSVRICSVSLNTYLEKKHDSATIALKIWANDPMEPDLIVVQARAAAE